jgi:hypothetical protein
VRVDESLPVYVMCMLIGCFRFVFMLVSLVVRAVFVRLRSIRKGVFQAIFVEIFDLNRSVGEKRGVYVCLCHGRGLEGGTGEFHVYIMVGESERFPICLCSSLLHFSDSFCLNLLNSYEIMPLHKIPLNDSKLIATMR